MLKILDLKSELSFGKDVGPPLYIYPLLVRPTDSGDISTAFDAYGGYSQSVAPQHMEHAKRCMRNVYSRLPFCFRFTTFCTLIWLFVCIVLFLVVNNKANVFDTEYNPTNHTASYYNISNALNITDDFEIALVDSPE